MCLSKVYIFGNYDGGTLYLNVDQNISNINVGVVTYRPCTIHIMGTQYISK